MPCNERLDLFATNILAKHNVKSSKLCEDILARSFCWLVELGLDIVKLSSQRMQGEHTGTGLVQFLPLIDFLYAF